MGAGFAQVITGVALVTVIVANADVELKVNASVGVKVTLVVPDPETVSGIWLAPDQPGKVLLSGVSVPALFVVMT